ncbi:CHC2 zinc finger domain-containing protein [Promicromonospora sp. NFX87]|uniref:CHC2 zinc finger domain-containing protein n=1 Tax=Promicromonospora sp. NFX87 TaxID=3402691 RepID=UPI003AFB2078
MSALTVAGGWGPKTSLDRVRNALVDGGYKPDMRRPDDFMALCPLHGERTGSFHVTWTHEQGGRVRLHCFGCPNDVTERELAEALGLGLVDLFDNPPPDRPFVRGASLPAPAVGRPSRARTAGKRRGKLGPLPARKAVAASKGRCTQHDLQLVTTYQYVDVTGALVQEVMRWTCKDCGSKEFTQRFTTADGSTVSRRPEDFVPVLYRLPEVVAAVDVGEPVFLVEGEKDADNGVDRLGVAATTNTGGARAFTTELAQPLRGASVYVVLDRDGAGWARGVHVHEVLTEVGAAEIHLLLPATTAAKSDLTDHVDAGHGRDDFLEVELDDVRVWDATARVEAPASTIRESLDEAQYHLQQAEEKKSRAPKAADEHRRFAERWCAESEIQWEKLEHAAATVAQTADGRGGEWAQEAVQLSEQLVVQSAAVVQETHRLISRPVPASVIARTQTTNARTAAAPVLEEHLDVAQDSNVVSFPSSIRGGGGEGGDGTGGEGERDENIERKEYAYLKGSIVQVKWSARRDGTSFRKYTELLNLDLHLDGREYVDNTDEVEDELLEALAVQAKQHAKISDERVVSHYLFSYTDPITRDRMQFRISEDRVRSGDFLEHLPVVGLKFDHTKTGKARIIEAVRSLSGDSTDVVQYRGTGWRLDRVHGWSYVHLGGLITAKGVKPGNQILTGALSRYLLPTPTDDAAELRRYFTEHSASFLDRFSPRVGAVLCGQMYCAPLERVPYSVVVQGSPGSRKSGLCALAMHHFGTAWDRNRATVSMTGNGSTLNSVRILAHQAKDAVVFFDDVTPGSNAAAAQARLGEYLQLLFNQEVRDRAERDGHGLRAGMLPHATGLFSSELLPKVGAGARRALLVPLQRDEINVQDLIELDAPASRMARATLMASYLSWAARDLPGTRRQLRAEIDTYTQSMHQAGRTNEEADTAGYLWAGWAMMTAFLQEVGAISADERIALLGRVHEGIFAALESASDPDSPMTVGQRLRELIASGLRQGVAHVTDVATDDAPSDEGLAIRLGWRRENLGPGFNSEPPKSKIVAQGRRVGYVNTGTDEVLLDSTSLEALIKAAASHLSEPFTMDAGTARRALHEVGVLKAQRDNGSGRWRYTMKRTISCETHATDSSRRAERYMTVLTLSSLLGDDDGNGDDTAPLPPPPAPLPPSDEGPVPHLPKNPTPPTGEAGDQSGTDEGPLVTAQESTDVNDTDSTALVVEILQEPQDCVHCDKPTRYALEEVPLHRHCWPEMLRRAEEAMRQHAAAVAAEPAPSAPGPAGQGEPVLTPPSPAAAEQVSDQPEQPQVPAAAVKAPAAVRSTQSRTASRSGRFTAAAAVLDIDLVYLPDGSTRPAPQIRHLGDVAQLAYDLNLGVQVVEPSRSVRGHTDPGVVVVTEEVAEQLGIRTRDLPRGDTKAKAFEENHIEHPALMDALSDGWHTQTPRSRPLAVKAWTKLWRADGSDGAYVSFIPLLSSTVRRGDATPAQIARRLGHYAHLMGANWRVNGGTVGVDLMKALRVKRREEFTVHEVPRIATAMINPEFNWTRPPSESLGETTMKYVHAYDRGGSHLAGVAGLELPVGEFVHHPEGTAFDPKLTGLWKITMPERPADWRYPDPLFAGVRERQTGWFTTPVIALAIELEHLDDSLEVLEAYVWPKRARVLDPWYSRIRDARAATDAAEDPDCTDEDLIAVRKMIKETYTRAIGLLNAHTISEGRDYYSPERYRHILGKARSNLDRRIVKIGIETGRWPLAVNSDTVLYASDEPDADKAWPGDPEHYGLGLGQFKPEGHGTEGPATGLLADQLPYLTGGRWDLEGKKLVCGEPKTGDE